MKTKICKALLVSAVLFGALRVQSQPYSIDWHTVDGGGGAGTSSQYHLSGTIGQPDASPAMTGGNFSIAGGFWSLIALQSPGAPLLNIFCTSTNSVIVSWPSPSIGFSLQQNTNMDPSNWIASSWSVTDNGTNKFVIVSPPAGNRYFRLSKQ